MKAKITKRTVDAAKPGKRDTFIWDTETKGFGLKVTPAGKKVYLFQYRLPGQKYALRITIGEHGDPWTAEKARVEAEKYRGDVKHGINPAAVKRTEKAEKSVAELCDLYLAEGCETKKPSTLATDQGRIERHIKPLLGNKRVKDITQNDIKRFMKDVAAGKTKANEKTGRHGRAIVTGGKGTATRTVGLLGGIFSFAVGEGIRPDNPVRGVKRYADKKGERYLSPDEMATLGETLTEAENDGENSTAIAAIRLLILTGCRKSEILTLQWAHVDFDLAYLRLPDSKTGEKIVPLGAPALELLASLPRVERNPYVLPGEKEKQHLVGLPRVWKRIRNKATLKIWADNERLGPLVLQLTPKDGAPSVADIESEAKKRELSIPKGLTDVRLHDLRHSFASVGAGAGMGLPIVGKLLGHRDPKTTARYAHIADDPAKAAADRIAGTIAAAMNGEGGKVVKLEKQGA